MIDHHAPARADAEEARTADALIYLERIKARCVEMSPEILDCIERCRKLEEHGHDRPYRP